MHYHKMLVETAWGTTMLVIFVLAYISLMLL